VDRLAGQTHPWFYLLRPFAVPELVAAFEGLAAPVRQDIHAGRCYILIDYAHEGYSHWMFERVYEALRVVPLPNQQIILLSGDFNAENTHRWYCETQNIRSFVRVHSLNYFKNQVAEYMASDPFRASHLGWEHAASKHSRSRLFVNFNRRNRLHRILTVVRLHQRGLLGRGLVSMAEDFEGRSNEEAMEDEATRFALPPAFLNRLRAGYSALRSHLPLRIDVEEMTTNHAHTHPTWPYHESWLSLVSETLFFESAPGQVFLSEKVWKPIMNFHPFLVIGDVHSLGALRRMGFRTFHPYMDESYDFEPDHETRLEMVLNELSRLAKMSEDQCHEWFQQMEGILIYNFEQLRADHFDERFRLWVDYVETATGSAITDERSSECDARSDI
jgi:hypothetical protein